MQGYIRRERGDSTPLWSLLKAGRKFLSLNPLGAEAKLWLSAPSIGGGGGGGVLGGGTPPPPIVYGRSNTFLAGWVGRKASITKHNKETLLQAGSSIVYTSNPLRPTSARRHDPEISPPRPTHMDGEETSHAGKTRSRGACSPLPMPRP